MILALRQTASNDGNSPVELKDVAALSRIAAHAPVILTAHGFNPVGDASIITRLEAQVLRAYLEEQ